MTHVAMCNQALGRQGLCRIHCGAQAGSFSSRQALGRTACLHRVSLHSHTQLNALPVRASSRPGAGRTPDAHTAVIPEVVPTSQCSHLESAPELRFQRQQDSQLSATSSSSTQPAAAASSRHHREARLSWRPASWRLAAKHLPTSALLGLGAVGAGALGGGFDFQGPASTASALGVLAAIITIHECGHFLAARLQNIHVTKFAIGFGPPLLKYQGPEVEYSLRAIPFGGYVGFPDDDPANPESKYPKDDPDLLSNRPIKDRALVISAGVIANIIFAFSILLTQVSTVGAVSSTFQAGVVVPEVIETSVAYKAGFKAGDVITQVAGRAVEASPYSVTKVVNKIKASPNERLTITVRRDGQLLDIPVTPAEAPDGGGRIGVQLAMNAKITRTVAKDPIQAAALASKEFTKLLNTVTNGLQQIVFNFAKTAEQVTGPVAIVAVGAEVARADVSGLFQFAAIVNINLAVVNLLPLPALDGGYLALLLVELARGKKLPQDVERGIMGSGLLLLMAVGIVLVVRDTVNLFPKSLL